MNDGVMSLVALLGIVATAWLGMHLLYGAFAHQYGLRAEHWTPRQLRTATRAVLTLLVGFFLAAGSVLAALLRWGAG
jgi:hypothetical protein